MHVSHDGYRDLKQPQPEPETEQRDRTRSVNGRHNGRGGEFRGVGRTFPGDVEGQCGGGWMASKACDMWTASLE